MKDTRHTAIGGNTVTSRAHPARSAPPGKPRAVWLVLWLTILLGLVLGMAGTALAAGGSYSLDYCAADPGFNSAPYLPTYDKLLPEDWQYLYPYLQLQGDPPTLTEAPYEPNGFPIGRWNDPLKDAVYGVPADQVESLEPEDMALGQIVPFLVWIDVNGSTAPEDGKITFTCDWLCKTTSGNDFGFDPEWGVIAAFVDYGDAVHYDPYSTDADKARVDSFTWDVLDENTNNERIRGTFNVSGLDDGDTVVVEMWLVLDRYLPSKATGNVQTTAVSAGTLGDTPDVINVGTQTVPLDQVGKFDSLKADLSIVKTDYPDDPNAPGGTITYTIDVTNNSTAVVANGVTVTDVLDSLSRYVSSSYYVPDSHTWVALDPTVTPPTKDDRTTQQQIVWESFALAPGETRTISLKVEVTNDFTEDDDYDRRDGNPPETGGRTPITKGAAGPYDMVNRVSVTSITVDPSTANNVWYEPTNIIITDTAVVLTSFDAYVSQGRVAIGWETSRESDTAGFYVERWDAGAEEWVTVNKKLVPALLGVPAGGSYAVPDRGAAVGEALTYRLVEIEISGERLTYGPFEVTALQALPAGDSSRQLARGNSFASVAHAAKAASAPAAAAPVATATAPDRLRIEVTKPGFYHLDAATIAKELRVSQTEAARLISTKGFKLTNQGRTVAYLAAKDGSALYFYGQSFETVYTSTNVYWLTKGAGALMINAKAVSTRAALATSFVDTIHYEQNLLVAPAAFHNPEADYTLWSFQVAGETDPDYPYPAAQSFAMAAPDANTAAKARLDVFLQGMTETGDGNDHHVVISVNSSKVGEATWSGHTAKTVSCTIPTGVLVAGDNTVVVEAIVDAGVPYNHIAVDSFDLAYTRSTTAVAGQLLMKAAATAPVQVGGLSSKPAYVLDLSTPLTPKIVPQSGSAADGSWLKFNATAGRQYLVADAAGALDPDAVIGTTAPALATGGAQYVIITTDALREQAQVLADYRASAAGWKTKVVTIDEVYDAFSNGIATPRAIQSFITTARSRWSPALRYVVLAGEGTYDYQNFMGYNDCMVPTMLTDTPDGLAPSDVMLADVMGSDGVPEIAIGRIPALTAEELANAVAKIKDYEAASGQPKRSVLFVADDADDGGDFAASSDLLATAAEAAGLDVDKAYLGHAALDVVRGQLLSTLQSGALMVNYVGHGGWDILAEEEVLAGWDDLPSSSCPPVLTALTCFIGCYADTGYDSLSEVLVKSAGSGAVAVWSPSTFESNGDSVKLGLSFHQKLFGTSGAQSLGDIIKAAAASAARNGVSLKTLRTYNLLGDPALQMAW